MKAALIAAVLGALLSAQAEAGDSSDRDPYFALSEPRVELLEEEVLGSGVPGPGAKNGSIGEAAVILDQIISIGKKVWEILEAGRPVVNIQTDRMSALPRGATHWGQLESWSNPVAARYKVTYVNGFGMEVVSFQFRVVYTYGGRVNGKGRYLANVSVIPADTSVAWGYTFNARAELPQVLNVGTSQAPIAGTELHVHWEVKTVIKDHRDSVSLFIRGDGRILDLGR